VHWLVLSGEVPELAAFYPSAGGEWDSALGWDAFQQVLESRRDEIRVWLDQPPQTNEVGRAAALMGGLLLWHSVMWQYLTADDQAAADEAIVALGKQAGDDAPFAHLFLEPTRRTPDSTHEFLVVLTLWPGGERRVLGGAAPHGIPSVWERDA
jgi:hypothetical protein